MKRKKFISSLLPLALSVREVSAQMPGVDLKGSIKPPYLKKGDQVGITSPAGTVSREDIDSAIARLEEWGFRVKVGDAIGKSDFTFGGTDAERLSDMQKMLDDKSVKAILSARGGYGLVRIIDKLDFGKFRSFPKWIIGFSDITVMHNHINRHYNIATLHSKMCNSFPFDWENADPTQKDTITQIRACLTGEKMRYVIPGNPDNKPGLASGPLVGGNMKTIESLLGTASELVTDNKILFLEDTGEYLYSIDRMFWHLKRTGKLSRLKGLVVGGFKIKPDDPGEEFGRSLQQLVLEKIKPYSFPVCFDFPIGHQLNNFPVKCGVIHTLKVNADEAILSEK